VEARSKKIYQAFWTMGFLLVANSHAQSQQLGMHGPRWGFAVASSVSKDTRHPRLARTWNHSDNVDTVWIVMGRSHTAPVDSIRLSVRSGPPPLASEKDPIAATYRSDSLGQWAALPVTLLSPGYGERNVPMPMRVLGVFSPSAIASWARSQNPNRSVVTRVAADVWRRKTYERVELYLEPPAINRKQQPIATQSKASSVKKVRK
jgi:hypothetical protein